MKRLIGFFRQAPADRGLLLQLLVFLPMARAMLRVFGYVRFRKILEGWSRRPLPVTATAEELKRADRLAGLAALAGRRGLLRATCLPQALVVHALLRRRGLLPELRIGVRKPGEAVEAHAWVELQGRELGAGALGHQAFDERAPRRA